MRVTTTAFGQAVTGSEVTVAIRVTIAWPSQVPASYQTLSDLTVQSCRPIRETQTDMPAGTVYVTGRASASMGVTLAGLVDGSDDSKTIAWLMGPYQSTSPLYRTSALGLSITADMGVLTGDPLLTTAPFEGVEFVRVFTGVIDDYVVDHAAGSVTLTCIDPRALLRTTPALPMGAYNDSTMPQMSAQYVLNYLCEAAGLYTVPPPASGTGVTVLHRASGQGSAWPEVTSPVAFRLSLPSGTSSQPVTGRFGSQIPAASRTDYYPAGGPGLPVRASQYNANTGSAGPALYFEGWIKNTGDPSIGNNGSFAVAFSGGTAQVQMGAFATTVGGPMIPGAYLVFTGTGFKVFPHAPTLTVPVDGQFHYVSVKLTWVSQTAVRIDCRVDGATETANSTFVDPFPAVIYPSPISVVCAVPAEGVQLVSSTSGVDPFAGHASWTSDAVWLDPSLNRLVSLPDVAGQDAWGVIQDIATAERGIAGFDEVGRFVFRNRLNVAATPSRTFTATECISSMQVECAQASVVNHVVVPVNQVQVSPQTWIWSAPSVPVVPARGQWSETVTTDNPVCEISTVDSGVLPVNKSPDGRMYWRACTDPTGAGPEVTSGIAVTARQLTPTTLAVVVTNTNSYPVYLCSPDNTVYPDTDNGSPMLLIGGRNVTSLTSTSAGSSTAPGTVQVESAWPPMSEGGPGPTETLLTLSASDWRQSTSDAQALADDLIGDLYKARPQLSNLTVTLDPRVQLRDRVTISDTEGSGINDDFIVSRIEYQDDWTMTLELRAVSTPGGWLMGVPGRSEMGVGTYA